MSQFQMTTVKEEDLPDNSHISQRSELVVGEEQKKKLTGSVALLVWTERNVLGLK